LRSIDVKVNVTPQSTSNVPQTCRVMLTIDREPRGTTANFSDIVISGVMMGAYELNNRKRFQTILDEYIDLGTFDQGTNKTIVFKKSLYLPVVFNATNGGTIADIQENTVLISMIGDQSAAGSTYATLQGTVRFRFTDE